MNYSKERRGENAVSLSVSLRFFLQKKFEILISELIISIQKICMTARLVLGYYLRVNVFSHSSELAIFQEKDE